MTPSRKHSSKKRLKTGLTVIVLAKKNFQHAPQITPTSNFLLAHLQNAVNTNELRHLRVSLNKRYFVDGISMQRVPRHTSNRNRHLSCNDPFHASSAAFYR